MSRDLRPAKKMLVDHAVIEHAIRQGRETDLGEFLSEAQHDFEIFLLLDKIQDYFVPEYKGFMEGFGILFEPRRVVTKETLSWFEDNNGYSDFHAIMSEDDEIAGLASEIDTATEFYKREEGYAEFRKSYEVFLTYSGQKPLQNSDIEAMVEADETARDVLLNARVPDLKMHWEQAVSDRLVQKILTKIEKPSAREECENSLYRHFCNALMEDKQACEQSEDMVYASVFRVPVKDTDVAAALTAVEYHAANILRPD